MRVRSLGHAGLAAQSGSTRLVCDPWFAPHGAFQASWFQYPSNESQLEPALDDLDAILISHEHMDHVDPWFLSQVPAEVPVISPRYPSPVLERKILAGGKRPIVLLDAWEQYQVGEVTVFFVPEESPMNHDSAMMLMSEETSVLNMNDARLTTEQVRRVKQAAGGDVGMLFLQAAGASWYPICYDYPANRLRQLSLSKRQAKLAYVQKIATVCDASTTFPSAGPPAFLDEELFWINDQMGPEGIFPDQEQAVTWLRSSSDVPTALLLPGDLWDHSERRMIPNPEWEGFLFSDRDDYLRSYADQRRDIIAAEKQRYPWPEEPLWPAFRDYFAQVLDMSAYFNKRIGIRVGFDIQGPGGGRWSVDFTENGRGVTDQLDDVHYTYTFASRWLPPLLSGDVPWEDFFLSCRFRATRSPDEYNDHLLGLLKFAWPEALDAVEAFETGDRTSQTIEIIVDGVTYEVQRFCPHAGQDLSETGEVLAGGVLRCLGHHFEWDLATGQCINGRSDPLEVHRLDG